MNKYECLGRICENQERQRGLKEQISELKKAIISSLNDDFKGFIWQELTKQYHEKNIKLKELNLELESLRNQLNEGENG